MRIGKLLPNELEENILSIIKNRRKETLLSAKLGEDCAAFKLNDIVVVSTDPITGVKDPDANLGGLAIHISCNDVAACGAEPIAALLTIILPVSATTETVKKIMIDAENAAKEVNIEIAGGHTEFSDAVNRPIINATVFGTTKKVIVSNGMKAGRKILVTKTVGIEGTMILGGESTLLSKAKKAEAEQFLNNISVVKEGLVLAANGVDMMHDITEGGLLGSVCEVCKSGNLGAVIYKELVPVHPLTAEICKLNGIDPLWLIGSGSMLFSSENPQKAIEILEQNGITATVIGEFNSSGKVFLSENETCTLVTL